VYWGALFASSFEPSQLIKITPFIIRLLSLQRSYLQAISQYLTSFPFLLFLFFQTEELKSEKERAATQSRTDSTQKKKKASEPGDGRDHKNEWFPPPAPSERRARSQRSRYGQGRRNARHGEGPGRRCAVEENPAEHLHALV